MNCNLAINPPKCHKRKKKWVSQNGQTPNIIGICSYCVPERPVFEWNQVLLRPQLTPWWSFLFADGHHKKPPQIARFMGPTWGPPGSCRPHVGPMLAPWTLLSGPQPHLPPVMSTKPSKRLRTFELCICTYVCKTNNEIHDESFLLSLSKP